MTMKRYRHFFVAVCLCLFSCSSTGPSPADVALLVLDAEETLQDQTATQADFRALLVRMLELIQRFDE